MLADAHKCSTIEELNAASNLLDAALERYIVACSAIATHYDPSSTSKGVSQAISDVIPNEMERVISYETKLKRAKATINQTGNLIPTIAHINTLPLEVLTHIFQLIFEKQPYYFKDEKCLTPFPLKYPEVLSYVCSRWRQIAISSRTLWSQIEVVSCIGNTPSRYLLARAAVFAARADPLPLDLRIICSPKAPVHVVNTRLNKFCASVATRIKSVNLPTAFSDRLHLSVLQHCLRSSTPGTLGKIAITATSRKHFPGTFRASEAPLLTSRLLDIPHRRLEECLLPVKDLRLTGIYFEWTSQVYRGLVELHLVSKCVTPRAHITQSQLMGVLNSSPGLRALHFGFEIFDPLPYISSYEPIILNDLEELNLRPMDSLQYRTLLRFLFPGSKPLRLSLFTPFPSFPLLFCDEVKQFFARSNVTELFIESTRGRPLPILDLFGLLHMPGIRTLSLARFSLDERCGPQDYEPPAPVGANGMGSHPICSRLYALHLTYCSIDPTHLRRVVEVLPIQTLNLASCTTPTQGDIFNRSDKVRPFAEIVPTIKLNCAPGSLVDWDPWN